MSEARRTALRALQKLDEAVRLPPVERGWLLDAETELGAALGLTCAGVQDGEDPTSFSHNGGTCPVHEWLVEADQAEAQAVLDASSGDPL